MSSNSPNTLEYATEWESVREKIRDSRFYNTHLNELAKEWGLTWPVKRHNETPAKYLHHTWEELSPKGHQWESPVLTYCPLVPALKHL